MFELQLRNYYQAIGKHILDIAQKVYTDDPTLVFNYLYVIAWNAAKEIEEEEIEFNGHWCDDGGKAVE